MKTNKSFIAIAMVITALCMAACNLSNGMWGESVTETLDLEPFSHIRLAGNVDMEFTQGDTLHVEVYGNEKAIEANEIKVEGNVLSVSPKEKASGYVPSIKLIITAPSIESIDAAGAGDVDFKGDMKLDGDFSITMSGAGDIDIKKLQCKNLTITSNGAGDVSAKKLKSKKAKLQINGAGDIDAEIKSKDIDLSISGAGDATLDVKCDNLTVTAGGTGDIELTGECVNLTKSSGGKASIDSRNLTVKNMNIK